MPLITIVLPTWNGARYLDASIRSCVEQTFTDWELILVDDASTDETPRIVADWAGRDARIRPVRNDVNRKLPGALNVGFSYARGAYYTWTSDDNMYRPHALMRMYEIVREHPDVDLLYTDYEAWDEHTGASERVKVGERELLLEYNCFGACFLFRREVFEALGGYAEDLFLAEDYDFWLRASVAHTLKPLHEDLYRYRRHDRSLTRTQAKRRDVYVQRTLRRHIHRLHWAKPATRAQRMLRFAQMMWWYREVGDAMRCVWAAARLDGRCLLSLASRNFNPVSSTRA